MKAVYRKRISSLLLCACLTALLLTPARAEDAAAFQTAAEKTAAYVLSAVPEPTVGSVGGEWAVIALCRGDWESAPIPAWYEGYLTRLNAKLQSSDGVLSSSKYTEYSRVVLALSAMGEDCRTAGGYDLLSFLADRSAVERQGVNGIIWALIAQHAVGGCALYDAEGTTLLRADTWYLQQLLSAQLPGGGWSLPCREPADPDVTAMALTALAPYQGQAEVDAAIEAGLNALAALQNEDGSFGSPANAESCAQVVIALTELGLPQSRLARQGVTAADALLSFARSDGSFAHTAGGGADQMATEQALCALTALLRQSHGESGLFQTEGLFSHAPSISLPAECNCVVSYPDLSGLSKEAREAVEVLTQRGVFTGRSDGTFDPDASMTRAEFCAVLGRALGLSDTDVQTPFTDLPDWCACFVSALYRCGIVKGTDAHTFSPNGTITRQEAAVMLARAAQFAARQAVSYSADAQALCLRPYSDADQCGAWAGSGLALCLENGLLAGADTTIRPRAAITRAEIAQSVLSLMQSDFVLSSAQEG